MSSFPIAEGLVPFTFEGRTFEANGASVTEERIVAYPKEGPCSDRGPLGDCKGNVIGTWQATSSWRTPRSFVGSRMYQILATVQGRTYTGRGYGVGMIYTGRRIARERK